MIARIATVATLALAIVACEPVDSPSANGLSHGDPRPACQENRDPNRVAYYRQPESLLSSWNPPDPVQAPVTDDCPNDAITLSADGSTLYFFWSPVVGGEPAELLDAATGTYVATRTGDDPAQFGEPTYYALQVGAENASVDGALSFAPDGTEVIFHSTRADNLGYQAEPATDDFLDMYIADIIDGVPQQAVNLGEPANSVNLDGEHGLHPDGERLFFASDRPGGYGGTDIWVTRRTADGWSEPEVLPPPINTPANEAQPAFPANHPEVMYFMSDRDGPASIYRTDESDGSWSQPGMVITGYVGEPTPNADNTVLYFVHVLVDDAGVFGSNIWFIAANP